MKKNMMQTMTQARRIQYLENLLMIWKWRRVNA